MLPLSPGEAGVQQMKIISSSLLIFISDYISRKDAVRLGKGTKEYWLPLACAWISV